MITNKELMQDHTGKLWLKEGASLNNGWIITDGTRWIEVLDMPEEPKEQKPDFTTNSSGDTFSSSKPAMGAYQQAPNGQPMFGQPMFGQPMYAQHMAQHQHDPRFQQHAYQNASPFDPRWTNQLTKVGDLV